MNDLSTLKMITNSQKFTRTLMDCLESVHSLIEEVWVEHNIENYTVLHIAVTLTLKCVHCTDCQLVQGLVLLLGQKSSTKGAGFQMIDSSRSHRTSLLCELHSV